MSFFIQSIKQTKITSITSNKNYKDKKLSYRRETVRHPV